MKTKSGVNQFWISIPLGILAIAAFLFITFSPGYPQANAAGKDRSAPEWSLQDMGGKEIHSSDFKGKVVVLDFWATWCPPCRAEIPNFLELYKKYRNHGLVIVGISLDENRAALKSFVKRQNINYPIVLADKQVLEAFGGVETIPTTFVLNRSGQIVRQHVGFVDKTEFEKEIAPLLRP